MVVDKYSLQYTFTVQIVSNYCRQLLVADIKTLHMVASDFVRVSEDRVWVSECCFECVLQSSLATLLVCS